MELIEKGTVESEEYRASLPGGNLRSPASVKTTSRPDSFGALLEQGRISEALQLRLLIIEREAQSYRVELEQAKITSALVSGVGWVLSANPLIGVIAGGGMIGYCYVVARDLLFTGQLCPLPLTRINCWELFAAVGRLGTSASSSKTKQIYKDPLDRVTTFVEPTLAHEYRLIMGCEGELAGYLFQLKEEGRLFAYKHILRHTYLRQSLQLPALETIKKSVYGAYVAPVLQEHRLLTEENF